MAADTINFELHHKFSARVKKWVASHTGGRDLPFKGTAEFYATVIHHDRRLHGLLLASSNNSSTVLLAFSPDGNPNNSSRLASRCPAATTFAQPTARLTPVAIQNVVRGRQHHFRSARC
ncbi:hypothetical protein ZIOFF_020931 [Zingiber officinale]|uniref:Uncharacterized protein n=1 Tax=Zingiber officinale TaxID=94328 RepID=A0A8J5H167_ZINOF|nr:hypothetical protein ZIOFF_020931 [Zingiber officinale]